MKKELNKGKLLAVSGGNLKDDLDGLFNNMKEQIDKGFNDGTILVKSDLETIIYHTTMEARKFAATGIGLLIPESKIRSAAQRYFDQKVEELWWGK